MEKANAQIRAQCADMGIPPEHAPQLIGHWVQRSMQFGERKRRVELQKFARVTALTKTAIQNATLKMEEELVFGGLESNEAKAVVAQLPTVEQLMPSLTFDDLGVRRWQPDEDAAYQLTAPRTTDRKRRRIMRAIETTPARPTARSPTSRAVTTRRSPPTAATVGNPPQSVGSPPRLTK